MSQDHIAVVSTTIDAPAADVWRALVDPEAIRAYMFGTNVISDWKKGSPIVWKGEWQGKAYEDKGTILEIDPEHAISYSHFSPLAGLPDLPENYHTVRVELSPDGAGTRVELRQDNNPTDEAREHSATNWRTMLDALKKYVESA